MLSRPDRAGPDQVDESGPSSGAQKVTRLMEALVAGDGPQPLVTLAERLDMPKPTVHRLLSQLEQAGIAQRDLSGKGYVVGPTWLRLAIDALIASARQAPVRGIMRKLVVLIGESCNLGVLHDHEVLYLERVECDWPLRMQLQSGSRVPLHCTASGKLLLAQMSARNRRRMLDGLKLERYTANTICSVEAIEQECEAIRRAGIATNWEEYHLGLIGVAVPMLRDDGVVAATLAVHAPSFRMSREGALGHVPLLQNAASEIAAELGLLGS